MNSRSRLTIGVFCILWVGVHTQTACAARIVGTCGQILPDGEDGYLTEDLDCSAEPNGSFAVRLGKGSQLDLRGFTLTAPDVGTAVACDFGSRPCSPGPMPLLCPKPGKCEVTSTIGTGHIRGAGAGIVSTAMLAVSRVDFQGNELGISAAAVVARDVDVNGVGLACVAARRVALERVSCTSAGSAGISGDVVRGEDVTVTGCGGSGVDAFSGRASFRRLTATNNGLSPTNTSSGAGVLARRAALRDSIVTGNQAGGLLAPPGTPMDLFTETRPRVADTTCNHSGRLGNYDQPWGVCSGD